MNQLRINLGRKLNHLKLKWKIFIFLIVFCAILLFILWLFQVVLLDSFYRGIKVMEVKNAATEVAESIDDENVSSLLASIARSDEVSIDIVTNKGNKVYSTDNHDDSFFRQMSMEDKISLIAAASSHNGQYILYRSEMLPGQTAGFDGKHAGMTRPMQSIVYVKIVTVASGEQLAILINSQISPVNATVMTLKYQLYLITALMIVLAVLLALLIAKHVSRPIEEINQSAKELSKGNYEIAFKSEGFEEIHELSDTLNTAAADLSKVEGLRRELMANISHDMRTPLTLIYSYAEMMHDFPNEATPEQSQVIMDEAQRLTTLVNDVLDITKLESGTQGLKLSKYNLTESIDASTKRLMELIKKDGYTITFDYDRSVMVSADETKITQVYYNLLINAVNYTGSDKRITVRQLVEGETVRIEVSDTGEGIPQAEQKYIWERYYKVDKTHKRPVTGTGLGLSIVKKAIDLHGGKYGVISKPGGGSTFWFSLDRLAEPGQEKN